MSATAERLSAPDPTQLAAAIAEAEAQRAALEQKEWRESLCYWLFLDGERRVLAFQELAAADLRALKLAGFDWADVFDNARNWIANLDLFVAAWWLAGRVAKVDPAEDLGALLDRVTFKSAVGVHWPTSEERDTDGEFDASPPA